MLMCHWIQSVIKRTLFEQQNVNKMNTWGQCSNVAAFEGDKKLISLQTPTVNGKYFFCSYTFSESLWKGESCSLFGISWRKLTFEKKELKLSSERQVFKNKPRNVPNTWSVQNSKATNLNTMRA